MLKIKLPAGIKKCADGTTVRGIGAARWGFDKFAKDWAQDHGAEVQRYLASMFVTTANLWVETQRNTAMVRARKESLSAVFGIDPRETAKFFRDRDRGETNVKKKKIFHAVKPHVRKTGSAVRMHFRGAKQFVWNGYDIHITVPGWDHTDFSEFNASTYEVSDEEFKNEKMIDSFKIGEMISEKTWGKASQKSH